MLDTVRQKKTGEVAVSGRGPSAAGRATPHPLPQFPESDVLPREIGVSLPRSSLRAGQHLFWSGDLAKQIWVVQRGSLKLYGISGSGEERVIGFFFASGVVGWGALARGSFNCNAVALEPTTVFSVATGVILDGALHSARTQAWLLDGMSRDFVLLDRKLGMESLRAEQRLAAFLLWIVESRCQGGTGTQTICLPMSRQDIGSYLGLATETVSRRLTLFQRKGWITLRRRCLRVNDVRPLRELSDS
jgi:CRP/FNR family transcriptional regulator